MEAESAPGALNRLAGRVRTGGNAGNPATARQGAMMIDHAMLDHAIAAHAKWKFTLRKAIESGTSEWTVETARTDDRCEFGRWLRALPLPQRMTPHAREVVRLHAEFHARAAHVLELALAHRKHEATAAMALQSDFAQTSSKLTQAMTAWKKALIEHP